ncbi:PREDICTED: glutathione S-transferase theta-4-like [Cyprinodon variegatus]|uniref:glutathione S-transferase theta-4-like n=1 Tax=Cyprinodon variegatus TaxID=28743 RepID=UPI000742855E|nr:PREDICTED: glutathione S-transferase theta-4-like [Cyprinodon variegatus]
MALELYLDLFSQPCRSVYMFAKKNQIPFEFQKISLMEGEFRLAGRVAGSKPAMTYLAEKFQTPDFWYPADLQRRAQINEYLSWQHTGIRMYGSKMFWLRLMLPKVMGVEVPKEKMDGALEDLNNALNLIEEKFLQDQPFIGGDHMSLADLVAIVEIMQVS